MVPHFVALHGAGVDVHMVCMNDEGARDVVLASGVRHVPIPIRQTLAPLSDVVNLWRLVRLFRRAQPRIVESHQTKAGLLGSLAGWLARVPVRIYYNHGMAVLSAKGPKKWLLHVVEKWANRFATHTLFCGASTRDAAVEGGYVRAEQARVLGEGTISGIDVEKFRPDESGEVRCRQREAWGLGPDTVAVGFVGRLVPHKGILTLLAAWSRMDARVRERASLLLFGGITHVDAEIQDAVRHAEASGTGVQFCGWVDDMPSCYAGLDLLVLPSWHEGFPYSVLEAQATGLPAIVSEVSGNVDAVEHERTGLRVPVRDPDALARALERLISDEGLRARLGGAARQRILEHFQASDVLNRKIEYTLGLLEAQR
jgi:glycosyltransferase involved in cell wall biosynthesis